MDCQQGYATQDYNYKCFYIIVLLAVCDAKYNFTMVDVGAYGSNNASGVLLNPISTGGGGGGGFRHDGEFIVITFVWQNI